MKALQYSEKGEGMTDREIITYLFERREYVLTEIASKYSRLYTSILREALNDERDVEECANDVLMALWNSIPPNDPRDLTSYICSVARRIGIDRYRYNTRDKRGNGYTVMLSELEESLPDLSPDASVEAYEDNEAIKRALEIFMKTLDTETRVLFIRRYFYFESIASLADRFNMKENNVAVRLLRARKKLKKILEKEGVYV